MRPSAEASAARHPFLTPSLSSKLNASAMSEFDYFTATDNYPRAFRVGDCQSDRDDSATLGVLLLWRDDTATDQRKISVDVVRSGDKWLLDGVR